MSAVIDALLAYADSEAVNPTDPELGTCLYTDLEDPSRHCIAGQVWNDLGGDATKLPEGIGIHSIIFSTPEYRVPPPIEFTNHDVELLMTAQTIADGFESEGVAQNMNDEGRRVPRPWKEVIQGLKGMGLISEQ